MEHPVTVKCPLSGLEEVEITLNMAASDKALKPWRSSFGATNDNVMLSVDNWPAELADDPFGPDAPNSFRMWACNQGYASALREFINDPLLLTASQPSTPPIPAGE